MLDQDRLAGHYGNMRLILAIVATLLIALGLWLIAKGFMPTGPGVASGGSQISAKPQTTAGPLALGVALLAGGGFFFIMLLRRR